MEIEATRIKRTPKQQRAYQRRVMAWPHVGYKAELLAAAHMRSMNGRLVKHGDVEVWVDGDEKFPSLV